MADTQTNQAALLKVPERALLAFREALDRGSDKRMLTENGKQHFVFVGGVYLAAINFQHADGQADEARFDASVLFETDVKPYVFSASHLASMLQLFGGELAGIHYQYGEKVHRVTVELLGTTGFEFGQAG